MSKKIRALILKADSQVITEVPNFDHSLENMQEVVGGYIEALQIQDEKATTKKRNITIWLNEEGKLNGLPPNFALADESGKVLDIVMGDVLITACSNETGNTLSINDKEIEYIRSVLLPINQLIAGLPVRKALIFK